ncbi:MAG: PAS domain S-box protein [Pseudomonadota bacterium]
MAQSSALDAVVSTMVDGLIVIDRNGHIKLFNPACETIFGYSAEEALGQPVELLMPEPYRSEHSSYLHHYQRTGDAQIIGIGREVEGRRKSGDVFPMHLSVGEFQEGDLEGYVGVIHDLTEEVAQRQRLDDLRESHIHMSRLASMNQLGTVIAHELNQPLTALTNYLSAGTTVVQTQADVPKDKLVQLMERATEQARRAADMLSRMRGFVEQGKTCKGYHDIEQLARDALALVRPSFRNTSINFEIEAEDALPEVYCDGIQIQQVFVNLIRNGSEAMDGIDPARLTIMLDSGQSDAVRVHVADTGKGLVADNIETLFTPFMSEKPDGMGVGLSISNSILQAHGTQLSIRENLPRGTVFSFDLPTKD